MFVVCIVHRCEIIFYNAPEIPSTKMQATNQSIIKRKKIWENIFQWEEKSNNICLLTPKVALTLSMLLLIINITVQVDFSAFQLLVLKTLGGTSIRLDGRVLLSRLLSFNINWLHIAYFRLDWIVYVIGIYFSFSDGGDNGDVLR